MNNVYLIPRNHSHDDQFNLRKQQHIPIVLSKEVVGSVFFSLGHIKTKLHTPQPGKGTTMQTTTRVIQVNFENIIWHNDMRELRRLLFIVNLQHSLNSIYYRSIFLYLFIHSHFILAFTHNQFTRFALYIPFRCLFHLWLWIKIWFLCLSIRYFIPSNRICTLNSVFEFNFNQWIIMII